MKKELIKFLVLLTIAVGAGPASSQIWRWSSTSANNGSIDPSINMAEGMSPSAVNDSVRAIMARVANWRDDVSGLLTTAGTATAYTLATNEGFNPTPNDGQMIAFTPNLTNGTAVTLTTDGGTSFPIQTSPGLPVSSGTLIAGSPYTAKFSTSASAWILRDFYSNPFTIPVGGLLPYDGTTVPNANFIFPNGQCISRTTYAAYFAQVGTTHGVCDGSTTFAALDVRGYAIIAPDGGTGRTGVAANATAGSSSITQDRLPNLGLGITGSGGVSTSSTVGDVARARTGFALTGSNSGGPVTTSFNGVNGEATAQAIAATGSASITGSTSSLNGGVTQTTNSNMQLSYAMNYLLRIQ